MPTTAVRQLLLYESFVRAVLLEIRSEMKKQIDATFLSRLREKLLSSSIEIFEALDELIDNTRQAVLADVTAHQTISAKSERQRETSTSSKVGVKSSMAFKHSLPSASIDGGRRKIV
jgi:hypothetical protein